ncbi:hypothetical protein BDW74DRAFT_171527 [Aspergillus multicolor]|uniref:putative protein kinase n=1 Tax=Aspergillus multicolor TaxID=41759 RepID=UPI003CCCBB4F
MYLRRIFQSVPCKPSTLPAKLLPAASLIEEEHVPHYNPRHFYPVRLYETLNDRYQITDKIGYGTSLTMAMAPPRYVAIKVNANNYESQESAEKEPRITEHITSANPQHLGRNFVATLLDSFRFANPVGGNPHICIIFDVLCEPLWMLKRLCKGNIIPLDVLKEVTKLILEGLRYLHDECHVIHTDLKSDNILLVLCNPSIMDSVAQDEMTNPFPRKQLDNREIYLSRNYWGLSSTDLGRPPDGYRAPEVCLECEWSYSVDIWNLGVMLWDLFYGRGPFDMPSNSGLGSGGPGSADETHVAQIISLLGPLPRDLLDRRRETSRYSDGQGQFRFPELVRKKDLRSMANQINEEEEDKAQFVGFISLMLKWRPEDRATADGLLSHLWLSEK